MFLLVAIVVGVVTVPLVGGQLARVAEVHLRATPAILAGLGLQALVAVSSGASPALLRTGHVLSYVAAGLFVFANRHIAGVPLLGLGGALNGLAIVANGGVMPASPAAVARAGLVHEAGRFHNSAVVPDAHLAHLGDVFAIPASLPMSNVFSIGDVLLFAAGAAIIHALAGSPWTRRLRWSPRWSDGGSSQQMRGSGSPTSMSIMR